MTKLYSMAEIRDAYQRTFHKAGELWFDYLGDEADCQRSTDDHWEDFEEHLKDSEPKGDF